MELKSVGYQTTSAFLEKESEHLHIQNFSQFNIISGIPILINQSYSSALFFLFQTTFPNSSHHCFSSWYPIRDFPLSTTYLLFLFLHSGYQTNFVSPVLATICQFPRPVGQYSLDDVSGQETQKGAADFLSVACHSNFICHLQGLHEILVSPVSTCQKPASHISVEGRDLKIPTNR
jgi:hypothetical protein